MADLFLNPTFREIGLRRLARFSGPRLDDRRAMPWLRRQQVGALHTCWSEGNEFAALESRWVPAAWLWAERKQRSEWVCLLLR